MNHSNELGISPLAASEIRRPDGIIEGWAGTAEMFTQQSGKQTGLQRYPLAGAGLYTVQFGVRRPVLAGSEGVFAAVAVIDWMVAGTPIRRKISVTDGKSISGVCEGVNVYCFDVTPDTEGLVANAPYQIPITVAKGSRPAQGQPPTLSLFDQQFQGTNELAGAASVTVNIPQSAGVISVEIAGAPDDTAPATTNLNLLVQHVSAAGANVYKTYKVGAGTPAFVPVADDATQIIITNLDADHGAYVSVVWGIDG